MSHYREPEPENKPAVHPAWSGIGCILIIIIPIISFMIAYYLVSAKIPYHYIPLTPELANQVDLSKFGIDGFDPFPLNYTLVITFILTIALGSLVTVIYSIAFSVARPRKYGPLDADPKDFKRKTKKSR